MCIRDSAYGKQTKGLEDPRDVLGVGAVKAQRRQTQAADNKESVGHIAVSYTHLDVYKRQAYPPT